jgi:glycosyltransferase involved in cell wall biosynthesis
MQEHEVMRSVSVIVPTLDCAKFIGRALDSINSQTYSHARIEVLVIDDGSTDGTVHRVREFISRSDIKVRYVPQDHKGPAAARNHGIRLAQGQLIAFLDADDWWEPTKLERQIPLLCGATGFAYCDKMVVNAEGRPIGDSAQRQAMYRGDIVLPFYRSFFVALSSVVLTRGALVTVGGFDERLRVGEDHEFLLRLAHDFRADYVAEKLLVRRDHPDCVTNRARIESARNDLRTLTDFVRSHPGFHRRYRFEAEQRIARYRCGFARALLASERRAEGILQLVRGLSGSSRQEARRTLVETISQRGKTAPVLRGDDSVGKSARAA